MTTKPHQRPPAWAVVFDDARPPVYRLGLGAPMDRTTAAAVARAYGPHARPALAAVADQLDRLAWVRLTVGGGAPEELRRSTLANCRRYAATVLRSWRADGIGAPATIRRGRRWHAGGGASPLFVLELLVGKTCGCAPKDDCDGTQFDCDPWDARP